MEELENELNPAPQDQKRRGGGLDSNLNSIADEANTAWISGDVLSAGLEGFRTVSTALTTAQRNAAGAIADAVRATPDALGSAADLARAGASAAIDGAKAVADLGGAVSGMAGFAARAVLRAANAVTSTAGAIDTGSIAGATGAVGSPARPPSTCLRFRSVPSANSPTTNGCARTRPPWSSATRTGSLARRWPIQTDVSTRITKRVSGDAGQRRRAGRFHRASPVAGRSPALPGP